MKKIGKLHHSTNVGGYIQSQSSLYDVIDTVNALVDAHNELLETHTVKEPKCCTGCFWSGKHPKNEGIVPSNSETVKEEFCKVCHHKILDNGMCFGCTHDCSNSYIVPTSTTVPVKEEKETLLGEDKSDRVHVKLFGYRKDGVVYVTREEVKEEKDSCPYGTQTCRYNGNLCSLCRKKEPTTPENQDWQSKREDYRNGKPLHKPMSEEY